MAGIQEKYTVMRTVASSAPGVEDFSFYADTYTGYKLL